MTTSTTSTPILPGLERPLTPLHPVIPSRAISICQTKTAYGDGKIRLCRTCTFTTRTAALFLCILHFVRKRELNQLEHLNDALAYIEDHLDGTLDTDEAARIAACSAYQLKRMFPCLAEITLSEYVRCRAMTRVAQDLLGTHEKVIDIALRYGYEVTEGVLEGLPTRSWDVAERCVAARCQGHASSPLILESTESRCHRSARQRSR